jgi:hypothetical protein
MDCRLRHEACICKNTSQIGSNFEGKLTFSCYTNTDHEVQSHDGALNIAMDAWTFPNGQAYITLTVHFEMKGVVQHLLLDIVECAWSHSGVNLAATFAKVVNEFGISDKVW